MKQNCDSEQIEQVLSELAARDVLLAVKTDAQTGRCGRTRYLCSYETSFHGKQAHAAAHPWDGRGAFDGLQVAFHGVEFLRGHLPDTDKIRYCLTDTGGIPANVVPDFSAASFFLMAQNRADGSDLQAELERILDGAALITQTQVKYGVDFECEATFSRGGDDAAPLCITLSAEDSGDAAEALSRLARKLLESPEMLAFLSTCSFREE